MRKIFIFSFFFAWVSVASADVAITEIMYDLVGTDSGREWVEVENTGTEPVSFSRLKFFQDGTSHTLRLSQGEATTSPGGYAVIADDPAKFLADWPAFTGTIFNSSFSLNNTGDTIGIKDGDTMLDQTTYNKSMGASGDGRSLQKTKTGWTALPPTPGRAPDALGASGDFTTPSSTGSAASTSSQTLGGSSSDTASVSRSNWPTEQQIVARLRGPAVAVVGADVSFFGSAVGLAGQPLQSARFDWNFGDGESTEGETVLHHYNYPGDFVVILSVSSEKLYGMSRLVVHAVAADIAIAKAAPGENGVIEIANRTPYELDLSWWRLSAGGKFFTLPKNTFILSGGRLPLSAKTTGLVLAAGERVEALYPNGLIAVGFVVGDEFQDAAVVGTLSKVASSARLAQSQESPAVSAKDGKSKTSGGATLAATAATALADKSDTPVEDYMSAGTTSFSGGLEEATRESSWWGGWVSWFVPALGIVVIALPAVLLKKPKREADDFTIIEQ